MPSNIEIKARCSDIEEIKRRASELSGTQGRLILQEDTFFNTPNGRLKLRKLQEQPSELIFYDRPDKSGPKCSDYHITKTDNPADLKETLSRALGIKGEVKKRRMLYLVGQTRIHVDQVEGLGDFMELEVVMEDGNSIEDGQSIANDLMDKLGIRQCDLLTGAYMDLILKERKQEKDI